MDRSAVEAIVEREIGPLTDRLGLSRWRFTTACDLKDDETLACVSVLADYDKAHIRFNPGLFDDEDALLRTLRHELFHCVLAPYETHIESVREALAGSPSLPVLDRLWKHCEERAVINLELMYQGLNTDA